MLFRCSTLIRQNNALLGSEIEVDDDTTDDAIRKHLLELSEDQHDEKREALAVFNNKVIKMHAVQYSEAETVYRTIIRSCFKLQGVPINDYFWYIFIMI